MKMYVQILLAVLIGVMIGLSVVVDSAAADVPPLISYQGKLTDVNGDPVPDDDYHFRFRIYTDLVGGEVLWQEFQSNTPVASGLFNVVLGDSTPIPDTVFTGPKRWLGILVHPNPELTPRSPIVSVGYAFHAGRLQANDALFLDENAGLGPISRSAVIGFNYPDSNFDRRLRITAGRDDTGDNTQGANIDLHGNDCAPFQKNGDLDLVAGAGIPGTRGEITFWTGDPVAERMRITPDGRVGIGTTDPNAALQVYGAISRQNTTLHGNIADTHVNLGANSTTGTSGENYSYATVSGGNLNTASHQHATVGGGKDNTASGLYATVGGGRDNTAQGWLGTVGGGGENTASGHYATVAGGLENTASGDYAMVLGGYADTAAGNHSFAAGALVKITSDAHHTFAFGENFTTSTPDAVIFFHSSYYTRVGINKTDPSFAIDLPNNANVSGQGRANSWTTYSSIRWKENLGPIDNALDKVLALQGVYFDWKENGKHDIGMIAEEVGQVIPEVVVYEENGKDAKALDYARLVPVLVEAIKEQQQKISILEKEIAELEKWTGMKMSQLNAGE